MKTIKLMGAMLSLAACLTFTSCGGRENDDAEGSVGSGSASETTPNDSSGAESSKPMGVAEDNQNEELGYPPNQSNLNADSTRNKHRNEGDTTARQKR